MQRGAILAGWMVLGLVETVRAVQDPATLGVVSIPWGYALVGNFPWWFVWALLTPVVFRVADRWRLDLPGGWRWLHAHLMAGMAVIAIHLPLALLLWYFTNPLPQVRQAGFLGAVANAGRGYLLLELLTYGATLGLFYALDNHRRLHFRELDAARLAARAAELELSAVEARLDALRMEIDPHFLFNSLNTVSGLVRERELDAAVTVLSRLGELLRISLGQARTQQITLEQELAQLELYLDIERQRFRDRLTVRYEVNDEVLACLVPVLCLQPLVENAVRHGIARMPGPGTIAIRAGLVEEGRRLALMVQDTGPGFAGGASRAGIGLTNIGSRLTQLYGEAGTVTIQPVSPQGALVTLRLPAVRTGRNPEVALEAGGR
ncbi:MAG: histidine kinase [Gemmatimonadota bacterium]|nr:histidine kinase [Gemmatimonadota bacterium]